MNYISFIQAEALTYGVDEAIMIHSFRFWITKNMANKQNHNEGRTWTYNSQEALCQLFPFWTRRQIQRVITSLIDQKIILTGNFNKNGNDRTCWYAFFDENKFIEKPQKPSLHQTVQSKNGAKAVDSPQHEGAKAAETVIAPNGSMDSTESCNPLNQTVQPLPVTNTILTQEGGVARDAHEVPPEKINESKKEPERTYDHALVISLRKQKERGGRLEPEQDDYLTWANGEAERRAGIKQRPAAKPAFTPLPSPLPVLPGKDIHPDLQHAWEEKILKELHAKLGYMTFNSWIKPMKLHRAAAGERQVTITLPTQFHADWVKGHFMKELGDVWRDSGRYEVNVMVAQ